MSHQQRSSHPMYGDMNDEMAFGAGPSRERNLTPMNRDGADEGQS